MAKLPASYYRNPDVVWLAKDLLGKHLCTCIDGRITTAVIVETEAYEGVVDKASHAYNGRRTQRTETMYLHGGVAYVYFCYGMHYLFNIVTNTAEHPHAVLVRAAEPLSGIDIMMERRKFAVLKPDLTNGPGKLCQALGIDKAINGISLRSDTIWLENGTHCPDNAIIASPRIGVGYAQDHALWPYRFRIKGNRFAGK